MDEQLFSFILWGIGILFAIISFFIIRYINQTSKKQDENSQNIISTHLRLSESINKLQVSITGLNGTIISMQQANDNFTRGCENRHSDVNKKLDEHDRRLNAQERKIVELDTKVNLG